MHKLPVNFFSEAQSTGQFENPWSIQSGTVNALCAVPVEFGGMAGGFSPEDLFLQSLMNCFIGTFKVYAKASRIHFTDLSVRGQLTVDHNEKRQIFMKSVFLKITVHGSDRPERIETLVAKTIRDGFILNSVKTEIRHSIEIV